MRTDFEENHRVVLGPKETRELEVTKLIYSALVPLLVAWGLREIRQGDLRGGTAVTWGRMRNYFILVGFTAEVVCGLRGGARRCPWEYCLLFLHVSLSSLFVLEQLVFDIDDYYSEPWKRR